MLKLIIFTLFFEYIHCITWTSQIPIETTKSISTSSLAYYNKMKLLLSNKTLGYTEMMRVGKDRPYFIVNDTRLPLISTVSSEVMHVVIPIFNHTCFSARKGYNCDVPRGCRIQKIINEDGICVCMGYVEVKHSLMRKVVVNHPYHVFPGLVDVSFNGVDKYSVEEQLFEYILFKYMEISLKAGYAVMKYVLNNYEGDTSGGNLTITWLPHKYVCDDELYYKYSVSYIDDIAVYSANMSCDQYLYYNHTHMYCVLSYRYTALCPKKFFIESSESSFDVLVDTIPFEHDAYRGFYQYLGELIEAIKNLNVSAVMNIDNLQLIDYDRFESVLKSILNNIYDKLESIWGELKHNARAIRSSMSEFINNCTQTMVDQFIDSMNDHVGDPIQHGQNRVKRNVFGNFISNALMQVVKPILTLLEEFLRALWQLFKPVLKVFIEEVIRLAVAIFAELSTFLEIILVDVEKELESLVNVLIKLLLSLLHIALQLFLYFECSYMVVEWLLLVVLAQRYILNNWVIMILVTLMLLVLGIKREIHGVPSLFIFVYELRYNDSVCPTNSTNALWYINN